MADKQLVYCLVNEGDPRPAAIVTDQQVADEWAASSAQRDYVAMKIDDYTEGWLNTIESGKPGDSNFGKEDLPEKDLGVRPEGDEMPYAPTQEPMW